VSCVDCSECDWPYHHLHWDCDCSDVLGVKSSSEAPSHLRIPICFIPSLVEVVVSSDVFVHLLEKVSPRSVVASLQNIELWVLVGAP
jgi:hypothetical protein